MGRPSAPLLFKTGKLKTSAALLVHQNRYAIFSRKKTTNRLAKGVLLCMRVVQIK